MDMTATAAMAQEVPALAGLAAGNVLILPAIITNALTHTFLLVDVPWLRPAVGELRHHFADCASESSGFVAS